MSLFNIGFIIFPDLTQLDFTGPLQVLSRLPQSTTHIVAKSEAPVPSDCGLSLVPTHTFANCPPLDLICVPGGSYGVVRAIGDRETIEFVRRQAGAAKYVTSVCTGAFILGVAGILKGRRATTHWAFTDLLPSWTRVSAIRWFLINLGRHEPERRYLTIPVSAVQAPFGHMCPAPIRLRMRRSVLNRRGSAATARSRAARQRLSSREPTPGTKCPRHDR